MDEGTLVTGSKGSLGRALKDSLYYGQFTTKLDFDITNYAQMENFLAIKKPHTVIHCAAMTNVVVCELDKPKAYETNVTGTMNLIKAMKNIVPKAKLIYVSTPCVFAGELNKEYSEYDLPNPVNFYGFTKAIAEQAVQSSGLDYLIIRANFVNRGKWKYPQAHTNRFGRNIYVDEFADAIIKKRDKTGIVHVVADKITSLYEKAKEEDPEVKPIEFNQDLYVENTPIHLTINMTLSSSTCSPIKSKPLIPDVLKKTKR